MVTLFQPGADCVTWPPALQIEFEGTLAPGGTTGIYYAKGTDMLTSCFYISRYKPNTDRSRLRAVRMAGFTLIELMFVVAIVAILLALAYPSYVDQVRKARRADATSSLMDRAQSMERCFTRLNSYAGCPDPEGDSHDGFYTIEFGEDEPTATTYSLIATPAGDQVNDPCGAFKVDYLGNKTPVPDGNRCWGSS